MGGLILRVRNSLRISPHVKITFAGRLDPLARGIILLLREDMRYEKEAFLTLPKTYTFDLVFDVSTDTLDVLGKVTDVATKDILSLEDTERTLRSVLPEFLGKQEQSYPRYSSKTVKGIPLFEYARNYVMVKIPSRNIEIYSLSLIRVYSVKREVFLRELEKKVGAVTGDFRQNEINVLWNKRAHELPPELQVAEVVVECSSGTYVRVLAKKLASKMLRLGIADNITRTHVGEFTKEQVIV